jgi:mannosylglucosylglycerate synthase
VRALTISTRLAGTDGVSLEAAKVCEALRGFGYENHLCAGELDPVRPDGGTPAVLVPEIHFRDPTALALGERAFGGATPEPALRGDLRGDLRERAAELRALLERVLDDVRPDLLVLQNVWAVPMQLPLAEALAGLVAERDLPTLSHEHDYHWERERFGATRVPDYLATYFPFHAPRVRHLAINSIAAAELRRRRGLRATVVPNVLDFDARAPAPDAYAAGFRRAIGLEDRERLVLQPTRIVPRKGIEFAIDLLAELDDARNVLVVTHPAGDEGHDYLRALERRAAERAVDLRVVADVVGAERGSLADGRPVYALWDAYPHADFVTYPSLYEGFGNALLEIVWFAKPALVNRYPVYAADIAPKGFRFVEIDGRVTPEAVEAVAALLADPGAGRRMARHNLAVARRHFGYPALREALAGELHALGLPA